MTEQHPITPPDKLVEQWINDGPPLDQPKFVAHYVATQAARWGDEQRLKACCEWVSQWCGRWPDDTPPEDELRAAMRPKPPSLAEQAEQELFAMRKCANKAGYQAGDLIIDRALKRLAELENYEH